MPQEKDLAASVAGAFTNTDEFEFTDVEKGRYLSVKTHTYTQLFKRRSQSMVFWLVQQQRTN